MDALFWAKIALSFIVGGLSVTICTTVAERFGSTIGGVVGGFPTTAVVSLFFIGLADSAEAASDATGLVPLIVGINGLFLLVFYLVAKNGFLRGMGIAVLLWLGLSLLSWVVRIENFSVVMVCYVVIIGISYYVFEVLLDVRCYQKEKVDFSLSQLLLRALLSGAIISFSVFLSQVADPSLGGIFSVFPAVFISTLIIAYISRGVEFARSLTKPLMMSGTINVPAYAIAVRYLYPWAGLSWGTGLSFLFAVVNTYIIYLLMKSFQNKLLPSTR